MRTHLCCLLTLALVSGSATSLAGAKSADDPPAERNDGAPDPVPTKPPNEPRPRSLDLNLFWVPWGMHYTRAALGASLGYKIPLVQDPGVLWSTTGITFGVRNMYSFIANTAGPFVDITPIAFFRLQIQGAYDVFIRQPFNGGLRVLTPLGQQKLEEGNIERGNLNALDWDGEKDGKGRDNLDHFRAPIGGGGGWRLRVLPTLQGKAGPIVFQYNFTADWNWYSAPNATSETPYHDNYTFAIRKLHDFSHAHELLVAWSAPFERPAELLVGMSGRYQHIVGTGLDQLTLNALVFTRLPRKLWNERVSPFAAAQVGTNLIDPMWQYAFSWMLIVGADVNLYRSKT